MFLGSQRLGEDKGGMRVNVKNRGIFGVILDLWVIPPPPLKFPKTKPSCSALKKTFKLRCHLSDFHFGN